MTEPDRGQWATAERIGLMIECAFCGAQPGRWCIVVSSGNDSPRLHAARMNPGMDAWGAGYAEGRYDATPTAPVVPIRGDR